MFEEVPRTPRGLGRVTARRVVLGPFVVGGGVLLAAFGGSVAVAATVITASTIHISDLPPAPQHHATAIAAHSSATPSKASAPATGSGHSPTSVATVSSTAPGAVRAPYSAAPPAAVSPTSASAPSSTARSSAPAVAPSTSSSGRGSATPSPTPSGSTTSGPSGNALIRVVGYDHAGKRLLFEFAEVSRGTGPDHSDVYRVISPREFTVTLATDLKITSGGQLCPPAGSTCTTAQLIAAADHGFFAIAAIDPTSQLHSIIEVDNVSPPFGPIGPAPSPTTPAPGPSDAAPNVAPSGAASTASASSGAPSATATPSPTG